MSSEKKDEPAKLHTNLLALPPQTSPAFQIKVTFFEIMCHCLLQNVFFSLTQKSGTTVNGGEEKKRMAKQMAKCNRKTNFELAWFFDFPLDCRSFSADGKVIIFWS